MKRTLSACGVALLFGSWVGVSAAADFDIHNPENGYASDRDFISDPNVTAGVSDAVVIPGEDYYARLEQAEIAAMEFREISSLPEITFLPGWDPDIEAN